MLKVLILNQLLMSQPRLAFSSNNHTYHNPVIVVLLLCLLVSDSLESPAFK